MTDEKNPSKTGILAEMRREIELDRIEERKQSGTTIDLDTHHRKLVRWAAAGGLAGMAITAAVALLYIQGRPPAEPVEPTEPTLPNVVTADTIAPEDWEEQRAHQRLYEAFKACAIERYAACLEDLDSAERIDPEYVHQERGVDEARTHAKREIGALADAGKPRRDR